MRSPTMIREQFELDIDLRILPIWQHMPELSNNHERQVQVAKALRLAYEMGYRHRGREIRGGQPAKLYTDNELETP